MGRLLFWLRALARKPLVVAVVAFAVAGTAITVGAVARRPPKPQALSPAPIATLSETPLPSPSRSGTATNEASPSFDPASTPTPTPTPAPTKTERSASATPKPSSSKPVAKPAGRNPDVRSFAGLGAWIDLYDLNGVTPANGIADMKSQGVKTLYLQTSRYTCPQSSICSNDGDIARPELIGEWLERAHAAGIRVVGWYLPGYGNMERDVRRMVAVATFRSANGERFDALAIDIESKDETGGGKSFNDAISTHIKRVRSAVGPSYPVGAIVPSPVGMAIRPESWAGFPWQQIGISADIVLPMAYWSYRTTCGSNPDHCPEGYGRENTKESKRLTGLPVHVIGGIGDKVTADEITQFVRGARSVGFYGGSMYDYRTTKASHWAPLRGFNG